MSFLKRGLFLFTTFVDEPAVLTNMILLDGKKLSQKILDELKQKISISKKKLRLAVIVVGEYPVIRKFIEQKKKKAEEVGIGVRIYPFEEKITASELRKRIAKVVHEKKNNGVIVQLPLPEHIGTQYILNAITPEKDVDMLSSRSIGNFAAGKSLILPPVVGSIRAFLEEYKISHKDKYIVVVGAGNLVGRPIAIWLLNDKFTFSVLRSITPNPEDFLKKADIVISGVGKPKFITGDMIKEGAVVFDAGTSESEGQLVGDVDFASVVPKASFITPVPGGIGPVTVAVLLRNLLALSKKSS